MNYSFNLKNMQKNIIEGSITLNLSASLAKSVN